MNFCSTYYRSKGKPKISLIAQILYLYVLIPALALSVRVSFRALYLVRSFATFFAIVLAFVIMRILFKFKIYETIGNLVPIILSTLVMGAVALGLQQFDGSIVWQFVSIFICIIVYFATLLCLFPKMRMELLRIPKVQQVLKNLHLQK